MNPLLRGRLLVLAAAICWSFGGAAVKLGKGANLDGWQVAGFRSLGALLFMVLATRAWRAQPLRPGVKLLALSLSYAGMLIFFVLANMLTKSANVIFLQDTAPVWVLIFSPLILKERFQSQDLMVMAICACGLVLFFQGQLEAGEATGNVLALLSGITYALAVIGMRWGQDPAQLPAGGSQKLGMLDRGGAARPSRAQMIVVWGNALTIAICMPRMVAVPLDGEELRLAGLLAVVGVFQIGVGYWLLVKGLRYIQASEASLLALVEPILNPLWAYFAVGEKPGPWSLAGGAVVLTALAWQALRGRPQEGPAASASTT